MIEGKNVTVELFVGDTWYPVLCAKDMTLTIRQDVVLKTGPNSGTWRERVARINEWTLSVTGITPVVSTVDSLSFFHTVTEAIRMAPQRIRVVFEDQNGDTKQIDGNALIVANEISASFGSFANAKVDFEGSGPLQISDVELPVSPEIEVLSDWWLAQSGNNYVDGQSTGETTGVQYTLGNSDEILHVAVEGATFYVIQAGTPLDLQCRFTPSNGRIAFKNDFVFSGGEKVFVIFKRTT